jgi:hypothetical protein
VSVQQPGDITVPGRKLRSELTALAERLDIARDGASETIRWVARFNFPDHPRDYELVRTIRGEMPSKMTSVS